MRCEVYRRGQAVTARVAPTKDRDKIIHRTLRHDFLSRLQRHGKPTVFEQAAAIVGETLDPSLRDMKCGFLPFVDGLASSVHRSGYNPGPEIMIEHTTSLQLHRGRRGVCVGRSEHSTIRRKVATEFLREGLCDLLVKLRADPEEVIREKQVSDSVFFQDDTSNE